MRSKARRNSKSCGLCKPNKRSGNSPTHYPPKENIKRDVQDEIKEAKLDMEERAHFKMLRKIFGDD